MTADAVPARGSLRSRGAAWVNSLTLRQISAVLPPEQAWGLWLSRQIAAGIMDAFGPLLAGTRVESVDVVRPDGCRVVGEWVRAPGIPAAQVLFSPLIDLTFGLARAREALRRDPAIRAGGGVCELQMWPDQVHMFQALPPLSPEAGNAMAHVARFIDTSMQARGFDAAAGKAG